MSNNIIDSGIYYIENICTGQYYIGQSKHIRNRLKGHKNLLKQNAHGNFKLQDSYNTYGEHCFIAGILVHCPIHELNQMESYFIDKYDSVENGFNLIYGTNSNKKIATTANTISVSLKESTHNALASIGGKNDTYDDLVRMLLLNYDKSIFR